jgi:hypothetical protein
LGLGAVSVAAQYVVTHPQLSHNPINFDFLLDPLSKSEFLSFIPNAGADGRAHLIMNILDHRFIWLPAFNQSKYTKR